MCGKRKDHVNDENKDRLFKFVFGRPENKRWLLSLYNAVNHSHYENPDDIRITTIEDVIYMSRKNDLSFLIGDTMSFYEHQSTHNPNIPLRMMIYAGMVYSKYVHDKGNGVSLYSPVVQKVPVPKLICFYNGTRDIGESVVLRLSEDMPGWDESDIDARVLVLNINRGRNRDLMESCRPLSEYSLFVSDVRESYRETGDMDMALETAIRNLPADSEIRSFMESNLAEVKMKCLTEYNEEKEMSIIRRQLFDEGLSEGRTEGLAEGADMMANLMAILLKAGRTDDALMAAENPEYREKLFKEFGIS